MYLIFLFEKKNRQPCFGFIIPSCLAAVFVHPWWVVWWPLTSDRLLYQWHLQMDAGVTVAHTWTWQRRNSQPWGKGSTPKSINLFLKKQLNITHYLDTVLKGTEKSCISNLFLCPRFSNFFSFFEFNDHQTLPNPHPRVLVTCKGNCTTLVPMVPILKSRITLVHLYSRNKSDKEDCLFFLLVFWFMISREIIVK